MPLNNQICPPFFKFQEVWLTYNPLETSAGFLKPNEMHHAVQNVETLPEQRSVMNDTHSSLWTRYHPAPTTRAAVESWFFSTDGNRKQHANISRLQMVLYDSKGITVRSYVGFAAALFFGLRKRLLVRLGELLLHIRQHGLMGLCRMSQQRTEHGPCYKDIPCIPS